MLKKINSLYITAAAAVLFIALLVMFPDITSEYAQKGILIWYKNVLPAMLPFMILAIFSSRIGISDFIAGILSGLFKKTLNINGYGAFAVICAAISGYPMGAKITAELISEKKISIREGKKILVAANITSPAFIVGSVANDMFQNKKAGIIMLLCHYLSAFIICAFIKEDSSYSKEKISLLFLKMNASYKKQGKTLPAIFSDSVSEACSALISVCCFIMLFSILSGFLTVFGIMPSRFITMEAVSYDGIFISLMEMANGCRILSDNASTINMAFACAAVSFGGFCIHSQILSVLSNSGIKYSFILCTKAIHGVLSFLLFIVCFFKF